MSARDERLTAGKRSKISPYTAFGYRGICSENASKTVFVGSNRGISQKSQVSVVAGVCGLRLHRVATDEQAAGHAGRRDDSAPRKRLLDEINIAK